MKGNLFSHLAAKLCSASMNTFWLDKSMGVSVIGPIRNSFMCRSGFRFQLDAWKERVYFVACSLLAHIHNNNYIPIYEYHNESQFAEWSYFRCWQMCPKTISGSITCSLYK